MMYSSIKLPLKAADQTNHLSIYVFSAQRCVTVYAAGATDHEVRDAGFPERSLSHFVPA